MNTYVVELNSRVQAIKNRTEVFKLRDEISTFMKSPQFEQLSEEDRDLVMDLLTKVHSKEDQFKTCDPLDLLARPGELDQ